MEELKNIRHFQEFKDAVNEELLWDAIKNLFSKIFGNIDKKLADAVANFTKKLDKSKSWEESLKFYEEATKLEIKNMNDSMGTVTGPLGLRKIISDNSSINFIQLQELSNKYGSSELSAKKIFAGQPEAEMFNFDKSDQFNNNLLSASNDKLIELNKITKAYDEKLLTDYLNKNNNLNNVEKPAEQKPAGEQNPAGVQKPVENVNANYVANYVKNDALFEADAEQKPVEQKPAGEPVSGNQTKAVTTTDQNAPPKGNIDALKQSSNTWMTNQLYGFALDKVKKTPKPAKVGNEDAFDTIAKGSKATTLYPNMAKLLRNIVNITDKSKLLKVRDAAALAAGKTPDEFKNEMPL